MTFKSTVIAAAVTLTAGMVFAQSGNPTVGGAVMRAEQNIVENAVDSPIHTTLVAAVTQAGLVDTLASSGPFTVFAPTDDAFGQITEESLNALLLDENKAQLTQILTCHVVGAEVFSNALASMIADGGGAAVVETLGGCALTAQTTANGGITLIDKNGRVANVTIADVDQSNGVIHVIDRILLPKQ